MDNCQVVDCRGEDGKANPAEWTELWRVGEAKAFVRVCSKHSLGHTKGSRTSYDGGIKRTEAQAERSSVDA